MKESELSSRVWQKLQEFENIGKLQPSDEWNQSLLKRLGSVKPNSRSFSPGKAYSVVILLFVLLNLGFIVRTITRDSHMAGRISDLQVISTELLVNPVSIK